MKIVRPSAFVIAICALVPLVTGAAPQSVAAYYEDALARFGNGAFDEVIIQTKKALEQDQDHLPSRILLGDALLARGRYSGAEEQLLLALERGADRSVVDIPLARALLLQNKHQQLLERIDPWSHDPDTAYQLFLIRGRALLGMRDRDKAEWMFDEALQLRPEGVEALHGRAQVYLVRGEWGLARERLNQAARSDPDDPDAWYLLSLLEEAEGRGDEARNALSRALELDPAHKAALLRRAAMAIDKGLPEEAQKDVDVARTLMPDEPMVAYLQGVIHGRGGDLEERRRPAHGAAPGSPGEDRERGSGGPGVLPRRAHRFLR